MLEKVEFKENIENGTYKIEILLTNEELERIKDYISKEKLKKIYGKLCMELGSYVRDKATPQQERIAGAMNLLNKILEGNYEIWKNQKILL